MQSSASRCVVTQKTRSATDLTETQYGPISTFLWAGINPEIADGEAQAPDYIVRYLERKRVPQTQKATPLHHRCVLSGELLDEGDLYPTSIGWVAKYLWGSENAVRSTEEGSLYTLPVHLRRWAEDRAAR